MYTVWMCTGLCVHVHVCTHAYIYVYMYVCTYAGICYELIYLMLLENMKREVILIEARAANTRLTAAVVY